MNKFNDLETYGKKYILIMAGGSGTRMGSEIPKQLLSVGNFPMIVHLLNNALMIQSPVILVVSEKNKNIVLSTLLDSNFIKKVDNLENKYVYVSNILGYDDLDVWVQIQPIANGTGGAVISASDFLKSINHNADDSLLVLSADVPLITTKTMLSMFEKLSSLKYTCCILVKHTEKNYGYGRIVRDDNDNFVKIVEQKDCTEIEKQITLINNGVYVFNMRKLLQVLPLITCENSQNEYYLTDCPRLIKDSTSDNVVGFHEIDNCLFDETLGANTQEQLGELRKEYIKKFSIQQINDSEINTYDYNLHNLIKILHQLSQSSLSLSSDLSNKFIVNPENIRQYIQNISESKIDKKYLMVIRYEDMIVGTGSILIEHKLIHCMGKVGHIEDIVIDFSYRNLGLGKMLIKELIRCGKENGCYKIILDASDDVKEFYEKLGFKNHANNMRLDVVF